MIQCSSQPGSPVVEIMVEGTVTNKNLEEAINALHSGFDQDGKTRVIEIIQHLPAWSLPPCGPTSGLAYPSRGRSTASL